MASCDLYFSGHTGVLEAEASVTEITTSGTSRRVRLVLKVFAVDYSGARDGGYSVACAESGTDVYVPTYNGFAVTGNPQTIFDESFLVSIAPGGSKADISLSFSAWLISPSAGERSISGTITRLSLTPEPEEQEPDPEPEPEPVKPSTITLGADSVQMGKQLLISIQRENPGCTHILNYGFGVKSANIATGAGSSAVWTVPDLADQIPNALSGQATITCHTLYDGQVIGEHSVIVTLTVPDPAQPSVSGGSATLGTAVSIACKRSSANFTVKLELDFKGTTVTIANGKLDACSWTPGYELAKLIPSLTVGTGTLTCTTLNGTAEVGVKTTTIQLTVPENEVTRPRFTAGDLTLSPVSDLPDAFQGLYMRGKTGLEARFSASSDYSAITDYALTVGSQTATGNPAVIDLLVNDGNVKVTGKVTDARGFSTSVELTIQVMPYKSPRILPFSGYTDVVCERAMDSGELNPNGTYLAIKAGRSYSSVMLKGVEQNSCILRYRWKTNGAPAFTDWITLLGENSRETEVSMLIGNVVTSLQTSYLVEMEAVDALGGSHSLTFQIMTEAVSFVLYDGPDGAGFGKYPEEPHVVDIAAHMTLLVRGRLRVLGDPWVSLGLAEGISESAYEHGRKETGCFYLVTEGRHVHIAFNCAFSYAGTAVIINNTPIPEEHRPDRTVFGLCPANDRQMVCVSVGTDGYIRAEWVQRATDTVQTGAADVTWVDGYLCYWI